jgi:hypothetical protein
MIEASADEPVAISHGMAEVEAAVGLRGRTYYGAFDADGDEYRVCVQLREGDDPKRSAWRWACCREAATRASDSPANRQTSTA